ncbi:MAG: pyrroline-5-carboxylate reductase [Proteobacteria bacterium]|nr:pyrroline-5-carboxylate reductase [Pseudomonadota bacterium]
MKYQKVAFVGGGNMTRAIVAGMIAGDYKAGKIFIAEPLAKQRDALSRDLPGVIVSEDNNDVVGAAEIVVLAVKPQVLASVCRQLASTIQATRALIISVAAGIRSTDIDDWLGGGLAVVRIMPNQPALLRQGISGIFANKKTTQRQLAAACNIMSAVGAVVQVPTEADIDVVTAISGSGPAYFYLLIDMLAKTGQDLGLDENVARQLALETARGAAALAASSDATMETLIARVRSPGGTTAAALDSLESQGVRDIFNTALTAARDRAQDLANTTHQANQD